MLLLLYAVSMMCTEIMNCRSCTSRSFIKIATQYLYIKTIVNVKGADDVARTGALSPPIFSTRRDFSPAARGEYDKMRFKASIQNIHTFTSIYNLPLLCYYG
jgi:hypothetical protein